MERVGHPLSMDVEVRCIVCDRALSVRIGPDVDVLRELHKAGACVVGPNRFGKYVVEGCGKCLRFTTRRPGQEEGGE